MKQNINFLTVIDMDRKRSLSNSYMSTPKQSKLATKRHQKFPFFKAMNFNDVKFEQYPKWLTNRQDFMPFMYQNYESKLLTIPKICQKKPSDRASDEKYFISLYLQQIPIFQNLPSLILQTILSQIQTKKYQTGETIHHQDQNMQFMAIVFVGSVEILTPNNKRRSTLLSKTNPNNFTAHNDGNTMSTNFSSKRQYNNSQQQRQPTQLSTATNFTPLNSSPSTIKHKDSVIMSQAFYKEKHPTVVAKEETVLLCLDKRIYQQIQNGLKTQLYQKNRAEISDMMKSDFFTELHLKDKRALKFYDRLKPEFYFKGQEICEAGHEATKFYLHFKGQILEKNHIYIRQHNKWPLPHRRWQVRAVYNSYQNQTTVKPYSFFGDQQIIGQFKFKSTYIAKSFCIMYSMPAEQFKQSLTGEDFKRLKKYRNEHVDINYNEFEQKVRARINSTQEKKKIIHKAIDTSFANRTAYNMTPKKMSLLNTVENKMLAQSFTDGLNEENKFF